MANGVGGLYNDTLLALTVGKPGETRITPNRAFHINLRNNAGTEIGTALNPLTISGTVNPGGFSPPSNADAMQSTYPNATTEVYAFYSGGLAGALLQTITVTYTNSTKSLVNTVVKS